ncbi:phosphoglycolate phosphatase [Alkalilimnicola sp. S0819]|uniref:phosphoglycolate phosphatase n=1 Tax=Alkalilimnicola sp. S0819 TaxID=2613922 RepID=UPI00126208BA|nr:phosphoglycolate phosphatase [Alkalilimnicola sp. S0819]KAB7628152.1 phosphoglycolate phosphatase [Alkalilimnicola sp. S0819]MPQ15038.1 phosphoglycolate phosphatase [Alkalilimnicola sp. S0819]
MAAPSGDIRAVLFDLDGTLVDSAPDLAHALDLTLVEQGLPPAGPERASHWVGNGSRRLVARALTGEMWADPADTAHWDHVLERFFHHYGEHMLERTRPYPGVPETLAALREAGLRLAVVTNKPSRFVAPLLEGLELGPFELLLGGDSLPEKKPHPLPLLHAARQLGVEPAQTLMVGDSLNDVEAAQAAGMGIICVPYGYNHGQDIRAAGADAVLEHFAQLNNYLSITA